MKLINNRYKQHFDFDHLSSYFLIIENSKEYLKAVEELLGEYSSNIDSEFVLSDNDEIISISKNCLLLHNYFDLDINNKKIISEINNRALNFLATQDNVEEMCKLNEIFISLNDKIIENFDFKLEYDADLSYDKFIKLANFKIDSQTNFLERLVAYIKVYASLKHPKLVAFVGLSSFLSRGELELLLKELRYLELKCLFIEPFEKYKFEETGRVLIDDDLCEI